MDHYARGNPGVELGSPMKNEKKNVYVNTATDKLGSAVVLIFVALFTCTLRMMHYAVQ